MGIIISDPVTYRDEHGVDHAALCTYVHSEACINVLYVSADASKNDGHGRQIERASSVQRQQEGVTAHGRYFTT